MNVVGLDLSLSCTGGAVPGRTFTIRPPANLRGAERLAYFRGELRREFRAVEADLAILEGYAFAASDAGARSIAELGGVVRLLLFDLEVPFIEVPPASLKMFATGKGNATKDEVLASAYRDNGLFAGKTFDEADAYWLLELGRTILGRRTPSGRQREALEKVVVPAGIRRALYLGKRGPK
jgi:Holliday junction resolvasome RuvABC endonuclease subunit